MIIVDNSEASRNGDYIPSRFEAQADAVNLIYTAKTQANPESSVGLMSMGGDGPEVLTTLTTEMGKIYDGMHRTKIRGVSHFSTGINIAALALKHRQNNSQRPRIIVLTCSPIAEDEKSLVKLAYKIKKSGVLIDIIAFGALDDENVKKLQTFHEKIKGDGDGCHLAVIQPGPNLLSDSIVTTPILQGEGVSGGGGGGSAVGEEGGQPGGTNQFEFGVDPSMDPELALALRMSYEEEKQRQEREEKEKEEKARKEAEGKTELEGIKEEQGEEEKQPLLQNGEASGSKDDKKDDDKMDTA